jgi:hypothetical protein
VAGDAEELQPQAASAASTAAAVKAAERTEAASEAAAERQVAQEEQLVATELAASEAVAAREAARMALRQEEEAQANAAAERRIAAGATAAAEAASSTRAALLPASLSPGVAVKAAERTEAAARLAAEQRRRQEEEQVARRAPRQEEEKEANAVAARKITVAAAAAAARSASPDAQPQGSPTETTEATETSASTGAPPPSPSSRLRRRLSSEDANTAAAAVDEHQRLLLGASEMSEESAMNDSFVSAAVDEEAIVVREAAEAEDAIAAMREEATRQMEAEDEPFLKQDVRRERMVSSLPSERAAEDCEHIESECVSWMEEEAVAREKIGGKLATANSSSMGSLPSTSSAESPARSSPLPRHWAAATVIQSAARGRRGRLRSRTLSEAKKVLVGTSPPAAAPEPAPESNVSLVAELAAQREQWMHGRPDSPALEEDGSETGSSDDEGIQDVVGELGGAADQKKRLSRDDSVRNSRSNMTVTVPPHESPLPVNSPGAGEAPSGSTPLGRFPVEAARTISTRETPLYHGVALFIQARFRGKMERHNFKVCRMRLSGCDQLRSAEHYHCAVPFGRSCRGSPRSCKNRCAAAGWPKSALMTRRAPLRSGHRNPYGLARIQQRTA